MVLASMVLTLAASGAPAGCPAGTPSFYLRKPTAAEVNRAATDGRLKGRVVIRCAIGPGNHPRDCKVIQAAGARGGTVTTALRLSANVMLKLPDCAADSSLEGQSVTIPWSF